MQTRMDVNRINDNDFSNILVTGRLSVEIDDKQFYRMNAYILFTTISEYMVNSKVMTRQGDLWA